MVRLAASLMGTYFVAFAATSLVVAGYESPAPELPVVAVAVKKGDRLDRVSDVREIAGMQNRRVAEIELIGADDVLVILRDGDGSEVLRIDHASNTTIVAPNVKIPRLRLHAEAVEEQQPELRSPTPRDPGNVPDGLEVDSLDDEAGEEQIFACESGLSALADRQAAGLPRICLSDASAQHLSKS